MAPLIELGNRALQHRLAGWVLLGLLAVAYSLAYVWHPLFPGFGADATSRGWWTWADQQKYLTEAAAIAEGRLEASSAFYPVGYPTLGALFWRRMPAHAFFVPNMLLVLAAAAVWWQLATRWLSRVEALIVGVLFLVTHQWLVGITSVVPWSTIPTQAALLAGIWMAVARRGPRTVWASACLAAVTYVGRPIDTVAFLPLLGWCAWRLPTWRARLGHGAGGAALVVAVILGVAWLNLHVHGQWRSSYEMASTQMVGFFSYPVSYKFYWLFVDGHALFRETEPALLFRYAWLALAIPGVVFWIRREGAAAVAGCGALGVNWFVYVNYNDLLPSDVYRFTLIHYLAWGFPLLFVLAAAACRHGWRDRWVRAGWAGAALGFGWCAGLQLEEQSLGPAVLDGEGWRIRSERPLLIRFPDAPRERVADLRLDGRAVTEYSQYLVPYVESELQMLLGTPATGTKLTCSAGSPLIAETPGLSEFRWRWRLSTERLRRLCQ